MTSANFRGNPLKTPLNSTAIENIFTLFPDVSLEWLITGKGSMLRNEDEMPNYNMQDVVSRLEALEQKMGKNVSTPTIARSTTRKAG
ncbi:MAG: hypothetical protein ACRCSB_06550 [Bacteroidales bacterium]